MQLLHVATHWRQIAVDLVIQVHAGQGCGFRERRHGGVQNVLDINLVGVERISPALELRDVEDVVDQGQQMRSGILNQACILRDVLLLQVAPLMLSKQL